MASDISAGAWKSAASGSIISGQMCDAYYYVGMEHLLARDQAGASEHFKKSLKVGDDNRYNYMMARSFFGL